MSLEEEDEFWNRSDIKAFNFDPDPPIQPGVQGVSSQSKQQTSSQPSTSAVKTLGSILAAKPSSNEPFLQPSMVDCPQNRIEQLINFHDTMFSNRHVDQPKLDPKDYVREVVEKRMPIDFSPYKSKREKLLLLDCSICCLDGNMITAVSVHMSRTLKASIFLEEIKKRPIAVDHYINYLELTGKKREKADFVSRVQ